MIQEATQTQNLKLIEGNYKPSEAYNLVCSLMKENLNFHKIKSIKEWECNHNCDQNGINTTIDRLSSDEKSFCELVDEARKAGYEISIEGSLNISLVERY